MELSRPTAKTDEKATEKSDEVAALLDGLPVTSFHGAIVVLCALGLMFDVVEAALGNALSAAFSTPPHQVASYQLSLLLASVFAGGAIGAPLTGWLADRYGRRPALSASLLVLSVTSLMAATSADIAWLTFFRFLSGLALGAYPPLMVAYLSDVLPAARRGMLILLVGAIGFLGAPAVIFLVRWLTPLQPFGLEGWRCALIIGAAGAAIIGVAFLAIPESPRWLLAAGRFDEAVQACNRFLRHAGLAPARLDISARARAVPAERARLWSDAARAYRAHLLLLCALCFFGPWATIGFPLLSGAVLAQKGFQVADSLLFIGVSMLGPSLGVLIGAAFIDRIERRATLASCAVVMAAAGLGFAASNTPALLMAAGIAFNLVGSVYIGAMSIYAAELFPTALRATASSTAWAVNRVTSALVPLVLLPLLKASGALTMLGVIAAALCASATLVLAFGQRGRAGKSVD